MRKKQYHRTVIPFIDHVTQTQKVTPIQFLAQLHRKLEKKFLSSSFRNEDLISVGCLYTKGYRGNPIKTIKSGLVTAKTMLFYLGI